MSENTKLDSRRLHSLVAPYAQASLRRSLWQLANTLLPYLALFILMVYSLNISYWLTLLLAIPTAGFAVRAFIIFHDCCHASFFKSLKANEILGTFLGVVTFTPFHRWRHDHAVHHATAGNLDKRGVGDIWTMTVEEYLAAPWWMRLGYRVMRNPIFLCSIGSVFLFLVIQRFPPPKAGKEERLSVLYTDLALLATFLLLGMYFGYLQVFLVLVTVLFFSSAAGVWLFYVQHQFEGTYWEHRERWSFIEAGMRGSSFYKLPAVLQWFSGNIGFHHIHHLNPKIPNYNLPRCHRDTPAFQVKPLTIPASLKSARLHLWDEANQRLVGWEVLKSPQPVPVRERETLRR